MDKKDILSLFSRVGLSQPALSLYDTITNNILPSDVRTDETIRNYECNEYEGDILVPAMQTGQLSIVERLVLGQAFKLRGYNPVIVQCHNDMQICMRQPTPDDDTSDCELCYYQGSKIIDNFNFTVADLSEYIPSSTPEPEHFDPEAAVTYDGIDLKPFCKSSTRKALRKHKIDISTGTAKTLFQLYAKEGYKLAAATEKLIDEYNFEASVGGHHSYVYGVPQEVAHTRGIPTYVPRTGRVPKTLTINRYTGFGSIDEDPEYVKQNVPEKITRERKRAVDSVIQARKAGKHKDIAQVDGSPALDDDEVNICVFTNLIWDASIEGTGPGIQDYKTWLSITLETLREQEGANVIVKAHPGEQRGTNEPIAEVIKDDQGITDGITILPPDTNVNTYHLLEQLDIAIVYNSTAGLEAAYENIPVIVGGNTHYRGYGFTVDVESESHYRDILACLDELETSRRHREQLYSYLHYYFLQRHLHFPYFELGGSDTKQNVNPISQAEIDENNEVYTMIVQRILDGKPVHYERAGPYLDQIPERC